MWAGLAREGEGMAGGDGLVGNGQSWLSPESSSPWSTRLETFGVIFVRSNLSFARRWDFSLIPGLGVDWDLEFRSHFGSSNVSHSSVSPLFHRDGKHQSETDA